MTKDRPTTCVRVKNPYNVLACNNKDFNIRTNKDAKINMNKYLNRKGNCGR